MNMIEKVARALAKSDLTALGQEAFDKGPGYFNSCYSKEEQEVYFKLARIAITAMRDLYKELPGPMGNQEDDIRLNAAITEILKE